MAVINALGRRKSAVARVYVQEGSGKITINKVTFNGKFSPTAEETANTWSTHIGGIAGYITMPNKTGIEALRDIKAMDSSAKVVMCSAMGQEAMVVEAIKLGALDFIVKPFKPDRILATVSKILG